MPPAGDVVVIGGGLAGSLAALALAEAGWGVKLLVSDDPGPDATALSYGGVAWWAGPPGALGALMRQAPRQWRQWQRRYGDLGWRRCRLQLQGASGWERFRPWRFSRVDGQVLAQQLPAALLAAGVERLPIPPLGPLQLETSNAGSAGSGLVVALPRGVKLRTDRVVLAAGAGCRSLWPTLTPLLRTSWAGVLAANQRPPGRRGDEVRLPRHWQRPALERRAASLTTEAWIVDPGMAPWGAGLLAGQISLVAPGLALIPSPDPALMDLRLRQGLAAWDPALARLAAPYRQTAVAFSTDGLPLVGPLPDQPGLWLFSGFSGAFSQVPVLAPMLAKALTTSLKEASPSGLAPLAALGVLPR